MLRRIIKTIDTQRVRKTWLEACRDAGLQTDLREPDAGTIEGLTIRVRRDPSNRARMGLTITGPSLPRDVAFGGLGQDSRPIVQLRGWPFIEAVAPRGDESFWRRSLGPAFKATLEEVCMNQDARYSEGVLKGTLFIYGADLRGRICRALLSFVEVARVLGQSRADTTHLVAAAFEAPTLVERVDALRYCLQTIAHDARFAELLSRLEGKDEAAAHVELALARRDQVRLKALFKAADARLLLTTINAMQVLDPEAEIEAVAVMERELGHLAEARLPDGFENFIAGAAAQKLAAHDTSFLHSLNDQPKALEAMRRAAADLSLRLT